LEVNFILNTIRANNRDSFFESPAPNSQMAVAIQTVHSNKMNFPFKTVNQITGGIYNE